MGILVAQGCLLGRIEILPEQIEADLFVGNFACLQKEYCRPVEEKSLFGVREGGRLITQYV